MQKLSILSILCFIVFSTGLCATDYHVAKNGNDANDGSEANPFLTIGQAARTVVAGDVVIIHEGTYEETLRPNNPLYSVPHLGRR